MSIRNEARSWTLVAVPHDDVLQQDFDLSTYAANLGAVDTHSPGCPAVYRDAATFFQATYRTAALDDLLRGVAAVLGGGPGNRVLQLRTPFGGGKTHSLIALLHLFRQRHSVDRLLDVDFPNPGAVDVVVLPCLDLSPAQGREAEPGVHVYTLWGELAYRLGGRAAYDRIRKSDEQRTNPGSTLLRDILANRTVLVLLDEVLTYVEGALAVATGDSNLGRQTMAFLQHLTETISGQPRCAMVYSLQKSIEQGLGNESLLLTLDNLVSRVDAKREPVSGDDVLRVVQRRLFKDPGPQRLRESVADAFSQLYVQAKESDVALTENDRRAAEDHARVLRQRILDAYPFHPDLLDLMYHRWGSLPTYQRTRGALQFLATVVGALWKQGLAAGALIGPGDVPLDDAMVRNTFFTQVGEREGMTSVLAADLIGPMARCKQVDDSVARESPNLGPLKLGSRLTRALVLYSFGARQGEERGVLRSELLESVQMPDAPVGVLDGVVQQLSDTLLYVHTSGRRYRFEKKPNLNKLVDDEAKKFTAQEITEAVRRGFEPLLGATGGYVLWPNGHGALPDHKARFTIAFLDLGHVLETPDAQAKLAREWTENCGAGKRSYRNAVAFAIADPRAADEARDAARKIMACEALVADRRRHGLSDEDVADLGERLTRAQGEQIGALRQLYRTVLVPVAAPETERDPIAIESFDVPLQHSFGHQLLEAMHQALSRWVFKEATPQKIAHCASLGTGTDPLDRTHWISGPKLVAEVFGSPQYPKLLMLGGLQVTLAKGVSRGVLGYVMGANEIEGSLKPHGRENLTFDVTTDAADIDLTDGSYIVSAALARHLQEAAVPPQPPQPPRPPGPQPPDPPRPPDPPPPAGPGEVRLGFRTKGAQFFDAVMALQWLADWAKDGFIVDVGVHARGSTPLDKHQYETNVEMGLDEIGVELMPPTPPSDSDRPT